MKNLLFLLVFPLFLVSCSATNQNIVNSDTAINDEEYKVYSDYFNARINIDNGGKFNNICGKKDVEEILIEDKTSENGNEPQTSFTDINKYREIIKDEKLVNNYIKKNENECSWSNKFNLAVKYSFINFKSFYKGQRKQNLEAVFKYWKENPKKDGLYMLRRVGFNDKKDKALVYVRKFLAGQNAAGEVVLMHKKDNKWVLSEPLIGWGWVE